MKKYNFKIDDMRQIKKLIRLSNNIGELFKKQIILEYNGKKDTEEYKEILKNIKIVEGAEDYIYNKAELDYSKCIAWLDMIINELLPIDLNNNIDSIIEQDYENNSIRRVLNVLIYKLTYEYNELIDKDTCALLNNVIISKFNIKEYDFNRYLKLKLNFEREILNNLLIYLNDYSTYEQLDESIKQIVFRAKYRLLQAHKYISDMPDELCIQNMLKILERIDINKYRNLKDCFFVEFSLQQFDKLTNDCNTEQYNLFSMRYIVFMSTLLSMSNKNLKKVRKNFMSFNYNNIDSKVNDIVKNLIKNSFTKIEKDKKQLVKYNLN